MTSAAEERGSMLERRRRLAEQEDWIASATRAVELGRRVRRAYLDRTQMRNLQRVGETGTSVSAVFDYVKTQAGKHPQWRRENFGAVLLEEMDRLTQRAGKDVSHLDLCRLFLRQVAAAYVYSIAVDVAARPLTPPARPAEAAARPPVPRQEPAGRPARPAGPRPTPAPRATRPPTADAAAADAQPVVEASADTPAPTEGMPEQAPATVRDAASSVIVPAPAAEKTPVTAEPAPATTSVAPPEPPAAAQTALPTEAEDAAPSPGREEAPGVLPEIAAPAAAETEVAEVAGTGPEAPTAEAAPAGMSSATDAAETSAERHLGVTTAGGAGSAEAAASAVTDTESVAAPTQAPPEQPSPPASSTEGRTPT